MLPNVCSISLILYQPSQHYKPSTWEILQFSIQINCTRKEIPKYPKRPVC